MTASATEWLCGTGNYCVSYYCNLINAMSSKYSICHYATQLVVIQVEQLVALPAGRAIRNLRGDVHASDQHTTVSIR